MKRGLFVKRGADECHAIEPDGECAKCGKPLAELKPGRRYLFWINQVDCKDCRKVLWNEGLHEQNEKESD